MPLSAPTIFALSSGPPPAGIAVVRITGTKARFALETIVGPVPKPRRVALRTLRDESGAPIDRGLVLFLPGPGSYTGEDIAELHVHGGRAVIAAVLGRLGSLAGLRPAEPGEFTRRAFLNGRMDLTEVEGLGDLIRAETEAQRRLALRQTSGGLRMLAEDWRARLIKARAMVEADLDFADEDDVPASVAEEGWRAAAEVAAEIDRHLADRHRGERLREGAEVVLLGPVNAGKSSLLNALARREVAIVSPEPGTTRDLIELRLDIGGYPLTVVDTAGLREAAGTVEAEGVRRARARGTGADLVLLLGEAAAPPPSAPLGITAPVIRIGSKADLLASEAERARAGAAHDLLLSSVTGEGMEALIGRLEAFARAEMEPGESALVTRQRHRSAFEQCRAALLRAAEGADLPTELRAEELRRATDELARVTGRVDVEDLLDVIFRDFCIGK
jgi:tRNA modification GTPase